MTSGDVVYVIGFEVEAVFGTKEEAEAWLAADPRRKDYPIREWVIGTENPESW